MTWTGNLKTEGHLDNAVCIARWAPRFKGPRLSMLAPTKKVFDLREGDWQVFVEAYRAQLDALDRAEVLKLCKGKVLLCWCDGGIACHRRILACWLQEHTGQPVPEWGDQHHLIECELLPRPGYDLTNTPYTAGCFHCNNEFPVVYREDATCPACSQDVEVVW